MRAKWNESHASDGSTYGHITIKKVLDSKKIYNKREYEGYLNYHYRFRYNVVLGRTEINMEGEWKQLDDYLFNSIRRRMENEGAKITENKLQSLLRSNFVETYHPFMEYFHNLDPWDGKDYIRELADQVTTKDQEY